MRGRRKSIAVLVAVLMAVPLAVWASDRFEDVPDSNVFHDDISWLADSGVTFGCNPPDNTQFCPDDNVTREQMSAFMRRLSEGQVVDAATAIEAESATEADHATTADSATNADHATTADSATEADHATTADSATNADHATTADDADTVDGFDASALASRAAFAFSNGLPDQNTTLETTIEAPARGTLVMNATVDITRGGATPDNVICSLLVDGAGVAGTDMFVAVGGEAGAEDQCATTGAVVVDAGSHDVTFDITSVAAGTSLFQGSLNVMWVPFDGSGATPAAVAGQFSSGEDEEKSADE